MNKSIVMCMMTLLPGLALAHGPVAYGTLGVTAGKSMAGVSASYGVLGFGLEPYLNSYSDLEAPIAGADASGRSFGLRATAPIGYYLRPLRVRFAGTLGVERSTTKMGWTEADGSAGSASLRSTDLVYGARMIYRLGISGDKGLAAEVGVESGGAAGTTTYLNLRYVVGMY